MKTHLLRDLPNAHAESEDDEREILGTPIVFFDTAGCEYFERIDGDGDEGSRCNENEASVVKMWMEQLVSSHRPLRSSVSIDVRTLVGFCWRSTFTDRCDHTVSDMVPPGEWRKNSQIQSNAAAIKHKSLFSHLSFGLYTDRN